MGTSALVLVLAADDGKVYAKNAIVSKRWSAAPCKQPVPMAIDTAHHRLFSGCSAGGKGKGRPPVLPGSFTLRVIERHPTAR